jgi:hypothetical protein
MDGRDSLKAEPGGGSLPLTALYSSIDSSPRIHAAEAKLVASSVTIIGHSVRPETGYLEDLRAKRGPQNSLPSVAECFRWAG